MRKTAMGGTWKVWTAAAALGGAVLFGGCSEECSTRSCGAVTPDAKIFRATVRHVDMDGVSLQYQNTVSLMKWVDTLPDRVAEMIPQDKNDPQLKTAMEAFRLALRVINPSVLQAVASSTVCPAPEFYVNKSFSYLGENMAKPGLLTLSGANRSWPRLSALPADTRLAVGGELMLSQCYALIRTEAAKSTDPAIKALPEQLEALCKAQGEDLSELLRALDGEFELLVFGSIEKPAGVLTVSDKTGKIASMLRKQLKIDAKINRFPLFGAGAVKTPVSPLLCFETGKIVLASDGAALDALAAVKDGGLLATPVFTAYRKVLPAESLGYLVLNLDEALFAAGIKLIPPKDAAVLKKHAIDQLNLRVVAAGRREKDGFGMVSAMNFSAPELMLRAMGIITEISNAGKMIR